MSWEQCWNINTWPMGLIFTINRLILNTRIWRDFISLTLYTNLPCSVPYEWRFQMKFLWFPKIKFYGARVCSIKSWKCVYAINSEDQRTSAYTWKYIIGNRIINGQNYMNNMINIEFLIQKLILQQLYLPVVTKESLKLCYIVQLKFVTGNWKLVMDGLS